MLKNATLTRLKQFIDFKGFNTSSFERLVGFSNGSLASQIKNNKSIGIDKLEKILYHFPDLSSDWLLTGNGDMVKDITLNSSSPKSDITKYKRYKNVSKALRTPLSPNQRFISEDHWSMILKELRTADGKYEGLYESIEQIDNFKYFIESFTELYLSDFFHAIDVSDFFVNGNKFDMPGYKKEIYEELDKLLPFKQALVDLMNAIKKFYDKFSPHDYKKLLDNPEVTK